MTATNMSSEYVPYEVAAGVAGSSEGFLSANLRI